MNTRFLRTLSVSHTWLNMYVMFNQLINLRENLWFLVNWEDYSLLIYWNPNLQRSMNSNLKTWNGRRVKWFLYFLDLRIMSLSMINYLWKHITNLISKLKARNTLNYLNNKLNLWLLMPQLLSLLKVPFPQ